MGYDPGAVVWLESQPCNLLSATTEPAADARLQKPVLEMLEENMGSVLEFAEKMYNFWMPRHVY